MTGCGFCDTLVIICLFLTVSGDDTYELPDQKFVTADNYFYQASIHLNYNDEFLCGAAVVSSYEVLTVGSCLYYSWGGIIPPIIVAVKVGGSDLNSTNFKTADVSNITFHDDFDTSTMQYDLAVIRTSTPFQSSRYAIGSISIATETASSYNNCTVTGWNKETCILQSVDVEIIDCGDLYDKKVCAQPISSNDILCENSLGSLLVCNSTLIGILSVVPDCDLPNQQLIFEVAKYAVGMIDDDFISSNTSAMVRHSTILEYLFGILIFFINLFL
ncbi:trypsin iota-like [Diorhabda sublineata]|uniref:trypsin iota-like n=1 Tax=Diorhabda sublineata TaxID=1163346 RepID=UPI0024E0FA42|nr:trypsin iota-like [Diorhabda sublineata]